VFQNSWKFLDQLSDCKRFKRSPSSWIYIFSFLLYSFPYLFVGFQRRSFICKVR